jgi:hypothetical protein
VLVTVSLVDALNKKASETELMPWINHGESSMAYVEMEVPYSPARTVAATRYHPEMLCIHHFYTRMATDRHVRNLVDVLGTPQEKAMMHHLGARLLIWAVRRIYAFQAIYPNDLLFLNPSGSHETVQVNSDVDLTYYYSTLGFKVLDEKQSGWKTVNMKQPVSKKEKKAWKVKLQELIDECGYAMVVDVHTFLQHTQSRNNIEFSFV